MRCSNLKFRLFYSPKRDLSMDGWMEGERERGKGRKGRKEGKERKRKRKKFESRFILQSPPKTQFYEVFCHSLYLDTYLTWQPGCQTTKSDIEVGGFGLNPLKQELKLT
jgi:hypothetical protein